MRPVQPAVHKGITPPPPIQHLTPSPQDTVAESSQITSQTPPRNPTFRHLSTQFHRLPHTVEVRKLPLLLFAIVHIHNQRARPPGTDTEPLRPKVGGGYRAGGCGESRRGTGRRGRLRGGEGKVVKGGRRSGERLGMGELREVVERGLVGLLERRN